MLGVRASSPVFAPVGSLFGSLFGSRGARPVVSASQRLVLVEGERLTELRATARLVGLALSDARGRPVDISSPVEGPGANRTAPWAESGLKTCASAGAGSVSHAFQLEGSTSLQVTVFDDMSSIASTALSAISCSAEIRSCVFQTAAPDRPLYWSCRSFSDVLPRNRT